MIPTYHNPLFPLSLIKERGSSCSSVLRPQGRRKGVSLDPEIFGIEGHPEGENKEERF
jgi:hypothetical protein